MLGMARSHRLANGCGIVDDWNTTSKILSLEIGWQPKEAGMPFKVAVAAN